MKAIFPQSPDVNYIENKTVLDKTNVTNAKETTHKELDTAVFSS